MRPSLSRLIVLLALLLSACQEEVCPPDSVEHVADAVEFPVMASSPPSIAPTLVSIGGKEIEVDQVVHGPVCNDIWSGSVYVACDIQVAEWKDEEGPNFLDGCGLTVQPDTVVYVAYHNNAAYYNGCSSCHTSGGSP